MCFNRHAEAGKSCSAFGVKSSTPGSLPGPAPSVPVLPVTVTVTASPIMPVVGDGAAVTDVTLLASALIVSTTSA